MNIGADFSVLGKTKWYEYAVRFLFGGLITIATGILAKRYGPVFGGLFLAFPAIFPASATLIDKHEKEKKRQAGIFKTTRGRWAAALDARGATSGSIGLVVFAFAVWKLLPITNAILTLIAALAIWLILSVAIWRLRKAHPHSSRKVKG
jgi:hypothetical protein